MMFLFVYLLVFGIVQFVMFHWATYSCGVMEKAYTYPGGGHGEYTTPADNLVPQYSLLIEQPDMWYGTSGFDVFKATDQQSQVKKVGVWTRTWGPWFSTYTYQDIDNSRETLYVRATIMGMWFYTENLIMRCDGRDDPIVVTEGRNWMMNRVKTFLGSATGMTFRILDEGNLVALVEETYHGSKSANFRNATTDAELDFASGLILGQQFTDADTGDKYHQWFISNNYGSSMQFWKTQSAVAMYAFRMKAEIDKNKKEKQKEQQNPNFLVEQPDADEHNVAETQ